MKKSASFCMIALVMAFVANANESLSVNRLDSNWELLCNGMSDSYYTPTKKRVSIDAVSNIRSAVTDCRYLRALYLSKDGEVLYIENDIQRWDSRLERVGTYVIDTENIIHFTWDNGYEDSAKLSYQNADRAIITYRKITYYQLLDSDWD